MNGCMLCPRQCQIKREEGKRGFCGESDLVRLSRAALHMWEEPCISGINGSGAVFFSGCTLRCVYCQNYHISNSEVGKTVSVERLSEIFLELQEQGANNINLVTPGQYVPHIIRAVEQARRQGLAVPIVYNTGSYENVDTIKALEGIVDIYLPDFKYMDPFLAAKYSHAPDYFTVACQALQFMYEQAGDPVFDDNGIIQKGIIVRHLTLPGCMEDSRKVIHYLHEIYGDKIYISIMNQFTPVSELLSDYPELNHTISASDYDALVDYAIDIGVENGFIQEGETASESFIPEFDCEGV